MVKKIRNAGLCDFGLRIADFGSENYINGTYVDKVHKIEYCLSPPHFPWWSKCHLFNRKPQFLFLRARDDKFAFAATHHLGSPFFNQLQIGFLKCHFPLFTPNNINLKKDFQHCSGHKKQAERVDLGFAGGGRSYDRFSYLFCRVAKEFFNIEDVEIIILPG